MARERATLLTIIAALAKEARSNDLPSSNLTNDTRRDVRKDIARLAGVSTGNVTKVKQILDSVILEVRERLLRGEVSIHRAWLWRKRPPKGQRDALWDHLYRGAINKTIDRLLRAHVEVGATVRPVDDVFLHSMASLLGLGIEIPDYSTLCRRSRLLRKKLRIPKAASTQPIHLMIDSTGLRIHVGNARKPPKQRAWRKLHIAVDRETGNIVASELTASRARDATRVPALLTQIQAPLVSVAADSAYDKEAVYEAIEAHSPGRRNARGDSAATKRDAQSEFEHRHAGARSPYSCNRKTRPT